MTTNYTAGTLEVCRAFGVRLTVYFKGTMKSFPTTIQESNYLDIGIAISGPDYLWGSRLSIDWGYSFTSFLNSSGGPYIRIEIWKAYEFFNLAKKVVNIAYSSRSLRLNSSVTLIMQWDDVGFLSYYVTIDGEPLLPSPLFQYSPDVSDSSSPYFYLGPVQRMGQLPFATSEKELVKYFEFIGAWSAHSILRSD